MSNWIISPRRGEHKERISWNHHYYQGFCFYHFRWNSLLKTWPNGGLAHFTPQKRSIFSSAENARTQSDCLPETQEGSSGLRSISFVQEQRQKSHETNFCSTSSHGKKETISIISMFLLKPIQHCLLIFCCNFSCNWDILKPEILKTINLLILNNVWTGTESRILFE